jgi:hypothetical protein
LFANAIYEGQCYSIRIFDFGVVVKKSFFVLVVFYLGFVFRNQAFGKSIKCQKEAEAIGISESKKKANLSLDLLSIANPTEMDGEDIVVYVGAHANYNYFKMKLDKKCKLIKMEEVEYAQ